MTGHLCVRGDGTLQSAYEGCADLFEGLIVGADSD
jgi:hypothetical protein